ncbi:hypothetical protein [Methylobacterium nodulans]|uniref:Uncharacterized protein n=1 Tax=Methylobacterium nodulans (strain LMG 21967 / CNCM I-2342 / ORS 2060) TaxID=460265 RepID=B8IQT4_METNO|nr:hypothetical protein [Methylobacterium nodulans]ACL62379.1 conserved hypothetical protein [Methylobacterium nodulans ORS 2060]
MQEFNEHVTDGGRFTSVPVPIEHLTVSQRDAYAEAGEALLNQRLSRFDPDKRDAYWSAVRLCYNRPYNDATPLGVPAMPEAAVLLPSAVGLPLT